MKAYMLIALCFSILSCSSPRYDMEVVPVETLCDSTGIGPMDMKIAYEIFNYTEDSLLLEESYVMKCCFPLLGDSFPALEYPCVVYKGDTLFGKHQWYRQLEMPNTTIKIGTGKNLSKLIFNTPVLLDLYQEKYSYKMKVEQFLRDLVENGFFLYKRDGQVIKKKINKNIIFYDYGGGEVEFSSDHF